MSNEDIKYSLYENAATLTLMYADKLEKQSGSLNEGAGGLLGSIAHGIWALIKGLAIAVYKAAEAFLKTIANVTGRASEKIDKKTDEEVEEANKKAKENQTIVPSEGRKKKSDDERQDLRDDNSEYKDKRQNPSSASDKWLKTKCIITNDDVKGQFDIATWRTLAVIAKDLITSGKNVATANNLKAGFSNTNITSASTGAGTTINKLANDLDNGLDTLKSYADCIGTTGWTNAQCLHNMEQVSAHISESGRGISKLIEDLEKRLASANAAALNNKFKKNAQYTDAIMRTKYDDKGNAVGAQTKSNNKKPKASGSSEFEAMYKAVKRYFNTATAVLKANHRAYTYMVDGKKSKFSS